MVALDDATEMIHILFLKREWQSACKILVEITDLLGAFKMQI